MTTKDEALQEALEALEQIQAAMPFPVAGRTINTIRAALAQKDEQEPMAWMWRRGRRSYDRWRFGGVWDSQAEIYSSALEHDGFDVARLYSATPKRQPLTDEQIIRIMQDEINVNYNCWADHIAFCRAIEQAHGIGVKHD